MLVDKIEKMGVSVYLVYGKIAIEPKSKVTDEILNLIRENRPQLVKELEHIQALDGGYPNSCYDITSDIPDNFNS